MTYRIPFNRPTSAPQARDLILEALASEQLSGNGAFGRSCETSLEQLTGAHKALLTNSCSGALDISAVLLDAKPGDEVIVPSFTFVSTANAFASRGIRPVFADCRADTLNIDQRTIAPLLGPNTKAIVAMHYGGVSCDMDPILEAARERGIVVIEDNAHGLFGFYKDRPLGSLGALATQSFHETKNLTCGEGGALLVNDSSLLERAEAIREKGTNRSRFFRGQVDKYTWVDYGSNYLLSELQAALLQAQFRHHQTIQERRTAIWHRYDAELSDWARANDVRPPVVPPDCRHPSHLYYVLLPVASARPRLIEHLKAHGIPAVFHYVPLHTSPMGRRLGGAPGRCPVTEDISERLLRMPFYTDLTRDEQDMVIDAVRQFKV